MKVWRDGGSRHTGRGEEPSGQGGAAGDGIGRHRHGDQIHSHAEPHPHRRTEGVPTVGVVGAGAVGTALGVAIDRAGWSVTAVATRDRDRRERFRSLVPGVRAFVEPAALQDEAELILLCVPDDAIAEIVEPLRLYSGQSLAHTSGLLGAEVLEQARGAGSQIGAFHPLVSFTSDVERSVASIRGATIAVEGDERLLGLLADLAELLEGVPVRLPRGSKPAYHAAAVLASGGLVALLDAIAALGAAAGMDERGSLAVYGRLVEQTLANARTIGLDAALTGPVIRGDAGTIEAHMEALRRLAPGTLELYVALADREVGITERRGVLSPEQLERVRTALAKPA